MQTTPTRRWTRISTTCLVAAIGFLVSPELLQAGSTVQIKNTRYYVAEDAGLATVIVERVNDLDTVVSVRYGTAEDTALAEEDYTPVGGFLVYAVGETEHSIEVPILNDGVVEDSEAFNVILSEPSAGAVLGSRSETSVNITDNDKGFQVEYRGYQAQEDEGSVLVAVLRVMDIGFESSVDYATSDSSATAGSDYAAASGTMTFAPDDPIQFISIPIVNDGNQESAETFTLLLSNPSDNTRVDRQGGTATITIVDNDVGAHLPAPDPWSGGYWVTEDEREVTLLVHRGQDVALAPCTIDYATIDGTAIGDEDFVARSATISFGEGELSTTVTIQILEDEDTESTESFRVELSNPSPGMLFVPRNGRITVNILDSTADSGHTVENHSFAEETGCTLMINSQLSPLYANTFDVFWIDASQNLDDWTRLGFVAKRNNTTEAVSFLDATARTHTQSFYRIPSRSCIAPVPPPSGPYAVGVSQRILTDNSRRNRYFRSANASFRIWIYYPAEMIPGDSPRVYSGGDWVGGKTYHSYGFVDPPVIENLARFPIVLYSHGFRAYLSQFTDRAEELASHGYVVVAPDHFDATFTTLGDGQWLSGEDRIDLPGTDDRIRDLQLILDQCAEWNTSDTTFAGRLDLENVAVTGFSWGGETAAEICRRDDRVDVAMLQDAAGISTSADRLGIGKPFMQICANNADLALFNRAEHDAFWFRMSGAVHLTFDSFYWSDGGTDTRVAEEVNLSMRAYMLSFLDKYLKGKNTTLHEGPSAEHPRVVGYQSK